MSLCFSQMWIFQWFSWLHSKDIPSHALLSCNTLIPEHSQLITSTPHCPNVFSRGNEGTKTLLPGNIQWLMKQYLFLSCKYIYRCVITPLVQLTLAEVSYQTGVPIIGHTDINILMLLNIHGSPSIGKTVTTILFYYVHAIQASRISLFGIST